MADGRHQDFVHVVISTLQDESYLSLKIESWIKAGHPLIFTPSRCSVIRRRLNILAKISQSETEKEVSQEDVTDNLSE